MEPFKEDYTMKKQKKYQVTASVLLIFSIFVFTEIKAESHPGGKDRIIEVCSEGVVYVPPGTKIVKCKGKIKKIIKVSSFDPNKREGENCLCPNCCDGICGVIISCDGEPGEFSFSDSDSTSQGSLCVLWLDCE